MEKEKKSKPKEEKKIYVVKKGMVIRSGGNKIEFKKGQKIDKLDASMHALLKSNGCI